MDRSRRGPPTANRLDAPSSDKDVHSDDEIFREIEDYAMEAKMDLYVQADNPPYMCSHQTSSGQRERVYLGALPVEPPL